MVEQLTVNQRVPGSSPGLRGFIGINQRVSRLRIGTAEQGAYFSKII